MQHHAAKILDDLRKQKLLEARAKARRIDLEAELIEALGFAKPEGGSETFDVDGHKVTLKQPITEAVDSAIFKSVDLADKWRFVRRKYTLVAAEWKAAGAAERAALAPAITTKPGKVSVTIKEVIS